jgi:hypothetical protein
VTACQNCGAALRGPYCAACGQRHDPHVHSLGHFVAEAAETLTHADSRLWRTVATLLLRPGQLTREFFAGRRADQLPPFRLYLVVSVAFFLFASLLPESAPARIESAAAAGGEAPAREAGDVDISCGAVQVEGDGELARWLRPRLQAACEQLKADGGRGLEGRIWSMLPRAMFVLLPLMAALMLPLYWRPRRRYVEHLLLFVHNHAAAYLAIGLQLGASAVLPEAAGQVVSVAVALYLGWYLHRSMRIYYGQGRARTLVKFGTILLIYVIMASLVLGATTLYAFLAA